MRVILKNKKYDIQIKIIDTDTQKGPILTLPLDMIQEAKFDILGKLIESTIEEMENHDSITFPDRVKNILEVKGKYV